MPLASYTDANNWLDKTKIKLTSDDQALPVSLRADPIIVGQLAQIYPDHASLWAVAPVGLQEATPALVRDIAGLLYAAYYYEEKYSEVTNRASSYSRHLEARATDLIAGLRSGLLVLADVSYGSATVAGQGDVWPNDTTIVNPLGDNPQVGLDDFAPDIKFTMDKVF
jgi:hypothetical protein